MFGGIHTWYTALLHVTLMQVHVTLVQVLAEGSWHLTFTRLYNWLP